MEKKYIFNTNSIDRCWIMRYRAEDEARKRGFVFL